MCARFQDVCSIYRFQTLRQKSRYERLILFLHKKKLSEIQAQLGHNIKYGKTNF